MLMMVLWWESVIAGDGDLVSTRFAPIDSAVGSANTGIVNLAEGLVLNLLNELCVFVSCHALNVSWELERNKSKILAAEAQRISALVGWDSAKCGNSFGGEGRCRPTRYQAEF